MFPCLERQWQCLQTLILIHPLTNGIPTDVLQLQRSLKTSEAEKNDAQDRVSELTASTSSLQAAKRKAEQQLASLQEENEDLEGDAKEKGERLQKLTEQSNRMQSELMTSKEKLNSLEKAKSSLDQQVKDLTARLDDAVTNATKSAKREAAKLQARVSCSISTFSSLVYPCGLLPRSM